MHIVINQSSNVFGVDAENKIFAQSTETITFDVTFNDPQAVLNGLYCALLSDGGKTLALTTISENKAVLDTNTIECVDYVAQWAIGTTRHAFIVVGESTKPLAIIDVEVSQNPLEGLMPPTESAPTYPTSAELKAILADMTEQANRAEDAEKGAEEAQKAVAQYVDVTFPTKVENAENRLANATTEATKSVTNSANSALGAIDTKAQAVNTALDGKLATANTAINEAVGKAENAMRYTFVEASVVDGVAQLVDRAVNKVEVEGSVVFAMPQTIEGRVRDLMIDLTISAEVAVTFDGAVLPRDGDDSNLVPEFGRNIFLLTEIEPNTFLCSRCTVAEVEE